MQNRYYQDEAIESLFEYWAEEAGNPLIDLATGAGKSLVMAGVIIRLVKGWPDMRIGVVTHVKELIEQNFIELKGIWPTAPAGIFSAGLNRADFRAQILFGGIQTIWNKVEKIGWFDVILIDECHLIPHGDAGRYAEFFKAVREINPDVKIVGLTATPYRLGSGRLDRGEDRMFDRVIYTYGIADGVRDGYLTPLSSKATDSEIDIRGVGKIAGELNQKKLGKAADEITKAAVEEIVRKGQDKRSWLAFCSGKDHAYSVRDEVRRYGMSCESIVDDTPSGERRDILEAYKNYEIRCLTNNSVLTTGFNHKGVDLIAALRPTLSVSLYLQMLGRGTRILYAPGMPLDTAEQRKAAIAAGPKPVCLVLDFARLIDTHGPVDSVEIADPSSGNGVAPIKKCPTDQKDKAGRCGCGEKIHASVRRCTAINQETGLECGFEFDFDTGPKIDAVAADKPVMKMAEAEWRTVMHRQFKLHQKGKAPSIKVAYINGKSQIYEWLCPEHGGMLSKHAAFFWEKHNGEFPPPATALEWLERQNELDYTQGVLVKPGKNGYWDYKDYEPSKRVSERLLFLKPKEERRGLAADMNDDIPF